jgi:hypothetical protein
MRAVSAIVALAALGGLIVLPAVAQAAAKEPPACAAITFRSVPPGMTDGEQNAGLYKSRFGRIEVMATVKGGAATDYYVEVNGKRPTKIDEALPANVAACAKAKRLGAIGKPPEQCLGDRLAVLVEHSGERRYVLLFAHQGGEWHFCSAGGA